MTLTEEQREAIHVVSGLLTAVGCPQCHYYIRKNYTHHIEVPRAMVDSSGTVGPSGGFDLEKARASIAHYRIENPSNVDTESALKELVDQANSAEDAIAEIEWLRAYLEQSERVIEAGLDVIDQQAARIKSLKKEIRRLKHESKVEQEFTNSYIKRLHDAEARIKELEDAHKRSGAKYAKIINELRSSVYANIPGLDVGKIGPDAGIASSDHIVEADQTVGGRRCHI